ncbi:MAG: DUF697 domain-containing protein [Candidatus Adiutrix sp.]|jgi:uncharacterized membrane protein YcjF (UPF0283 family)|nr:DUF697 domain-containing protein [Candidatus Adiutrix sp.]
MSEAVLNNYPDDDEYDGGCPDFAPIEAKSPPAASSISEKSAPARRSLIVETVVEIHREDECVVNIPDFPPLTEAHIRPADPRSRPSWPDDGPNPRARYDQLRLNWIFLGALAIVTAFFGFYLFAQTINTVALAQTMPTWGKMLFLPPLALCGMVVIAVLIAFVWSWYRLNSFIQVNLAEINQLATRRQTRQEAFHHSKEAQKRLRAYLESYPIPSADDPQSSLSRENIANLVKTRNRLLAETTDAGSWIDKFSGEFLGLLDAIAYSGIKQQALKAGVAAMASPLPLLDSFLILGLSLDMLRQLCKIYNIRVGGLALPILLTKVIRNAFIADISMQVTEEAAHYLSEELGSSLLSWVGPKLAEGSINGIFMLRLGRSTQRLLRPVAGTHS